MRRSTRLEAKASNTHSITFDTQSDYEQSDSNAERRASTGRKKRRKAPAKANVASLVKRGRGGKLQHLPEMPLDILFEIFSHLLPYDLLRLSRAAKPLRQILMSRTSAFAWKRARANVPGSPLPECPPGLSEPAYANLVFDNHCHFCGAQGASRVEWGLFARACAVCHQEEFSKGIIEKDLSIMCEQLGIPSDRALTEIECLTPVMNAMVLSSRLTPVLLEYAGIEQEEQREEWKRAKREERHQIAGFVVQASKWSQTWKDLCLDEKRQIRGRRSAAILQRLKAEGWGDVIEGMDFEEKFDFGNHRLVKQNRDLTDRIWKNIKPEMIHLFQKFQLHQNDRRLSFALCFRLEALMEALRDHWISLPFDAVVPPVRDTFVIDSIKDMIFDKNTDTDPGAENFLDALVNNGTFSWRNEVDQFLCRLLTPSNVDSRVTQEVDSLDMSVLQLAISLFHCTICDECHLTYRQVLTHRCAEWHPPPSDPLFVTDLIDDFRQRTLIQTLLGFKVCPHRDRMGNLLKLCNLPEDTTMETFQDINPLVECLASGCDQRGRNNNRHAMYWHQLLSHSEAELESTKVLGQADLAGWMFQPSAYGRFPTSDTSHYGCRHCYTPNPVGFAMLKLHLQCRHDIEITTRESMEHYIIHPASSFTSNPYGILYGTPT